MKIVVVGGVAGGMSFAARARRLSEDAEIVVLERDPYVSFANCGLPYYLGGEIQDREELLLQTPGTLQAALALDVRTCHEVMSIDRDRKTVAVRVAAVGAAYPCQVGQPGQQRAPGSVYTEHYDVLVLSTGAAPVVPPLPGIELPQVRTLRSVLDVDKLEALVRSAASDRPRAVVVGAGFIGLETAEAFGHRGLEVTVVELADQVLAPFDAEMALAVQQELVRHGIEVKTSTSVTAVTAMESGDHAVQVALSAGDSLPADIVLLGIGVRPESSLARQASLAVNQRGAIVVDEHLRTCDPSIYALGDAIEVIDQVTGAPALVPLAGPANRQGRAAADHLFGRAGKAKPVLGTAIVRVFDLVAATTGQSEKALKRSGTAHHAIHLHPTHHAGYFPGASALHLKVVFAPDGTVLGAQATGTDGVDKRIDVIATAISAGMSMPDLAELELAYAPPFGSAKDPINMAGFIAENVLRGDLVLWTGDDLAAMPSGTTLLDVRSAAEFEAGHLRGALHIPHTQLRDRIAEVPPDQPVFAYCASGFRSYLAARLLRQRGFHDV